MPWDTPHPIFDTVRIKWNHAPHGCPGWSAPYTYVLFAKEIRPNQQPRSCFCKFPPVATCAMVYVGRLKTYGSPLSYSFTDLSGIVYFWTSFSLSSALKLDIDCATFVRSCFLHCTLGLRCAFGVFASVLSYRCHFGITIYTIYCFHLVVDSSLLSLGDLLVTASEFDRTHALGRFSDAVFKLTSLRSGRRDLTRRFIGGKILHPALRPSSRINTTPI